MQVAASFEIDLVPDSGLSVSTTLLVFFLFAYILVRGTVAVGEKLTKMIWPTLSLFFFFTVLILYNRAQADGNDVVRVTVEQNSVRAETTGSPEATGGAGGDSFSHLGPDADHVHD